VAAPGSQLRRVPFDRSQKLLSSLQLGGRPVNSGELPRSK